MNEMASSTSAAVPSGVDRNSHSNELQERETFRSAFVWLALFVLLINSSWAAYRFQYESLPLPLDAEQAGKRGFSEVSAMEHVNYLTSLGPHPVGSDALDAGLQYVLAESNKIKQTAHWEVDVQVNLFHAKIGANRLSGGLFKGKTLIYSDLKHVLLRILPKYLSEAEDNAVLISSHIDTVFSTEGAGDCSSCVSVMLELARATAQWAHGFKNAVIFLFNTGEEEGLNGAHSFISQHPWSRTIRFMVDLEAMGIGGKSSVFQSGPSPWAMETFAKVAKYPSGQVVAEDLFLSGVIKSATDFQVYQEVAGLSGLDFAYTDSTAVYHTKNDKLKLLKPGSLQHLGENMLAFLLQGAMSPSLAKEVSDEPGGTSEDHTIYFDVLGVYMVVYRQRLATMLHNSVILQALLIWATSLLMGGSSGAISLGFACLSVALMWIFSLSLAALVAFILPHISSSPMPYISNPWLIVGLFGAPALFGAFFGQHIGFYFLRKYLKISFSNRVPKLPSRTEDNLIKWEAERWLFKSGFVQWLIILVLGHLYKARSTYLALIWLVSPAFAYGLMEATLTPTRSPKQLKVTTLVLGLTLPVVISSANTIRLIGTIIGNMVRLDRDPGSTPEWLGNLIVAIFVAVVVCLFLVYLLSYIHNSGAKRPFIFFSCVLLGLSLAAVSIPVFPTYTEDIARAVNVVHIIETKGTNENQNISSYISLFSPTPGKLAEVVKNFKDEEFSCGRNNILDLVTSTVRYGCWSSHYTEEGWSKSEIPILNVESDYEAGIRKTQVFIDTKISHRWALAINTNYISDFSFEVNSEELVPEDSKSSVNGWHIIQFSGGKNSATKFHLNLVWLNNSKIHKQDGDSVPLLKLRTDVNRITPKVAGVLAKLPPWCSLFGKSTGPYTLAFVSSLPVDV